MPSPSVRQVLSWYLSWEWKASITLAMFFRMGLEPPIDGLCIRRATRCHWRQCRHLGYVPDAPLLGQETFLPLGRVYSPACSRERTPHGDQHRHVDAFLLLVPVPIRCALDDP